MRSKKSKVTAEHRRFREAVAEYADQHGSFPIGGIPWQMHHVVGGSYVQNKIPVGEWFLLPIGSEYHDPGSNNQFNVTHYRKRFSEEFGMQRDLFAEMVRVMEADGFMVPPPEVMEAIKGIYR